jgi:hypothetical protein
MDHRPDNSRQLASFSDEKHEKTKNAKRANIVRYELLREAPLK